MSITSRSYVVHEPHGAISLETVHYSALADREILVENAAVSVCASDLKAAEGKFFMKPPMILGHEAAGIVKQVGSKVIAFSPGDKVVLHYNSCKSCDMCTSGQNPYCDNMLALNFGGRRQDGSTIATTSDGKTKLSSFFFGQSSMGSACVMDQNSAVKVDATEDELKLFAALSCGVQTGAGAIFNVCKPPPGSNIAVFGAGSVGLSACLAARLTSPSRLVVIDKSEAKLELVPERLGIVTLCSANMQKGQVAEELKKMTAGKGFDYVLDCTGFGELVAEGYDSLRKRGTVVTVGGGPERANLLLTSALTKGLTYRGTHQGDAVSGNFIPYLIDLWRKGLFPFDKLITFYKLDELHKAMADLKEGEVIKPVLVV